jgi:hypothetical protein
MSATSGEMTIVKPGKNNAGIENKATYRRQSASKPKNPCRRCNTKSLPPEADGMIHIQNVF